MSSDPIGRPHGDFRVNHIICKLHRDAEDDKYTADQTHTLKENPWQVSSDVEVSINSHFNE